MKNDARLSLLWYREKFQGITVPNKHSKKFKFFHTPWKNVVNFTVKIYLCTSTMTPNETNLCHWSFIRKYRNIYTLLDFPSVIHTKLHLSQTRKFKQKPRCNSENKTKTNADFQYEPKTRRKRICLSSLISILPGVSPPSVFPQFREILQQICIPAKERPVYFLELESSCALSTQPCKR